MVFICFSSLVIDRCVGIVVAGARVAMGRSSPAQERVTVAFDEFLMRGLGGGMYVASDVDNY